MDDLGFQTLPGVSTPLRILQIDQESAVQSRFEAASTYGLTPFVGREAEVLLLRERWSSVKSGHGQVVVVSGEAGIGKSRLVQVVKEELAEEAHTRLECHSSPYFTNSALYPIIDMVQRTLRFQTDDTPVQKLDKLLMLYEDSAVPRPGPCLRAVEG